MMTERADLGNFLIPAVHGGVWQQAAGGRAGTCVDRHRSRARGPACRRRAKSSSSDTSFPCTRAGCRHVAGSGLIGLVPARTTEDVVTPADNARMSAEKSRDRGSEGLPSRIGRFVLSRRLGQGLHGTVYLGHDPQLARDVAIKVMHDQGRAGAIPPQAQHLARLRHPNIISLYEAGIARGHPYLVCEYVAGHTLARHLAEQPRLPDAEARAIIRQVVDAVACAHGAGVLHLDLTPGNIMIDSTGAARVMDFDLSRLAEQRPSADEPLAGTLRYTSPEHHLTGRLDARTDVYALGLILYELVCARPAVSVAPDPELPIEPVDLAPLATTRLGVALAGVIARALSPLPADRYPDACALREALASAEIGAQESTVPGAQHSTVQFLLRRMRSRQDFPAFSRTLVEINRMTSDDSDAPSDRLANVILRDYGMTGRLLKLANSPGYGLPGRRIHSVSEAIRLLGLRQVRNACNGLAYFGHLGRDASGPLRQRLVAAFVAGLMARHLATTGTGVDAEEAFIATMLQSLGATLAMHYFQDEWQEVEGLTAGGLAEPDAYRTVFGLAPGDLGAAVAAEWGLSSSLVYVLGMDLDRPAPAPEAGRLLRLALACNGYAHDVGDERRQDQAVGDFLARLEPLCVLSCIRAVKLFGAALEKFAQLAPALDVVPARCGYTVQAAAWQAAQAVVESEAASEPAVLATSEAPAAGSGGRLRRLFGVGVRR